MITACIPYRRARKHIPSPGTPLVGCLDENISCKHTPSASGADGVSTFLQTLVCTFPSLFSLSIVSFVRAKQPVGKEGKTQIYLSMCEYPRWFDRGVMPLKIQRARAAILRFRTIEHVRTAAILDAMLAS
jgi:hypothetical protein